MSTAYFACGCFWGVQHLFSSHLGVLSTSVGYMGGDSPEPTYEDVCTGSTGHKEVVQIVYDEKQVSYDQLAQYFFEIHNFEQANGQGPDIGDQYLSVIFTQNQQQRDIAASLIQELVEMQYHPATQILDCCEFWPAQEYHQNYYQKNHKQPYCHLHRKIF